MKLCRRIPRVRAIQVTCLATFTLVLFVVSGASSYGATRRPTASIKIGAIAPLTGPLAAIGSQYKAGLEAGVAYVNTHGGKYVGSNRGVLGGQLEIVWRDSAGQPTAAAAAVRDLIGQNVALIVGDGITNDFLAEVPALNEARVPAITPSTADQVWDIAADPWAFSTGDTSRLTVQADVNYLIKVRHFKRLGMIYETGAFGQSFSDATNSVMSATYHSAPVATQQFATSDTDVSAQLAKLRQANVDALLVWTFGPGLVKVFQGLDSLGWNVPGATVQGLGDRAVLRSAPSSVLKRFAGTNVAKTFLIKAGGVMRPEARTFFNAFYTVTHQRVYDGTQLQAIVFFDAALLAAQAINKAKSTNPQQVFKALQSGTTFTLTRGTRRFTAKDHVGESLASIGLFVGGTPCPNICVAAPGVLK